MQPALDPVSFSPEQPSGAVTIGSWAAVRANDDQTARLDVGHLAGEPLERGGAIGFERNQQVGGL
jgi:hypothetical protein